ncbi:MAG TPA: urease accessory protein UreD [Pseudolabrys sp.]|jgi:urease accessory protein|nr:urease accessory protein UreD [Pseudolabrys sp.]
MTGASVQQALRRALADTGVIAANRASGRIGLAVDSDGTRTRRKGVHEAGSLRVRFPNAQGDILEAVLINTAGGMTGGDEFSIRISLGEGARLLAGTAAAEKIYRSTGADANVALAIDAAAGSQCLWLPQETILFDRARLSRRINVNLAADATLVMAEAIVFGRSAMGETVHKGSLRDRWRIRRGGRLIFAENVRMDGTIACKLAQSAVAAGAVAVATVLVVPGNDDSVAAARAVSGQFSGEVGLSAWNGIAVARLCAPDGAALRRDLTLLMPVFGASLPRLWLQ